MEGLSDSVDVFPSLKPCYRVLTVTGSGTGPI